MREAVPPMDHLARALLMRGAREAAIMLLKAACRRGGDERPRCEALLGAVQARPTDRVSGPPIALDAALVEAVAASGRLFEARAIALGADLARTVAGVEIAAALEEVFDATDDWSTGWRMRWQDALATGSVAALVAIEREASVVTDPPSQLRSRAAIALRLLRGFSLTGATEVREPDGEAPVPVLDDAARSRIVARIGASDLSGALGEAHALAFDGAKGASEVAVILGRLVAAADQAMNEPQHTKLASTVPLGGPGLALFQLRMGNLAESQRLFRQMVLENPHEHAARQHLADLGTLERALSGGRPKAMPEPPARAPSTGVLDKRAKKGDAVGWASGPKSPQSIEWDDDDDSTSVMKSDHEAELLLRAGHPERALVLYEKLVQTFPGRPHFRRRKEEIEALIASSRALPIEPTVRRDVSALAARGRSVDPLGETGDSGAFVDDVSTEVSRAGRGVAELLSPGHPLRPQPPAPAPESQAVRPKSPTGTSSPGLPASRPLAPGASPMPASRPAVAGGGVRRASEDGADVHRLGDVSASGVSGAELSGESGALPGQVTVRKIVPVR